MSRKSIKLAQLLVLSSILFLIFSLDYCDGFKLRDLTESGKSGDKNKVTAKKNVFKDAPMKKITKIVKILDDEVYEDSTVEDDANHNQKDAVFIFEKVHKQHFDVTKRDIKTAMQRDDEGDDKENVEIEEYKINLFGGLFNVDESKAADKTFDDHKIEESTGFFNFFRNLRKIEAEVDIKIDGDEKPSEFIEESKGWLSYLNRMPFNLIYNFNITTNVEGEEVIPTYGEKPKHNKAIFVEDEETDDEIKHVKPKEPMNMDTFDRLLLEIPSFTPNYSKIQNIDCRRHGQIFQRQLRGQKNWALQSKYIE